MGDLTANISRHELKCKCGKCDVRIQDHEQIIQVVQFVCDHFAEVYKVEKTQLEITSAARCYEYNRIPASESGPGSNDESQHPRCNAMDIKLYVYGQQIEPRRVADYLKARYHFKYGIGEYNTFTHIDTRTKKARR